MPRRVPPHVRAGLRKQAVKGEIRHPDLARLTAHFFECAGGERAVAKMLYEEFRSAAEGSIVRQRILDMILRATRFTNEREASLGIDELGQLSDSDLQAELDLVMADLAAHLATEVDRGEEDCPEDASESASDPGDQGQTAGGPPADGGPTTAGAQSASSSSPGADDPAGAGPAVG